MDDVDKTHHKLVEQIRSGDQCAFEKLFHLHYSRLCVFSNSYLKSLDLSRDVVQEVFIKIWDNREEFDIKHSLKAYLYQAVRNQSLNHLEKNKQKIRLKESLKEQRDMLQERALDDFNTEELTQKIWKMVEELPERRKTIFILYRKHGLSYKEIAEVMGITRKTVENQMGKSLQFLRERLDL
ncbi:RNA polymerase sigma-70 factor [Rhodohalobacter sp.]|uniref:RNA polymerase sigma-70 factor n=1 Tax=Rhodohalobacter sp. TaxID=1974210 RepID=UPI002ACDF81E|nr:RNA polymerase sigma-70 factor [Rhodohalobacter sp.]MDZ7757966.1 RNA polymerase sigma-70 factor [Rhodohalobacter sp.]